VARPSKATSRPTIPPLPGEDDALWMYQRGELIKEQIQAWCTELGIPVAHDGPSLIKLLLRMAERAAWEEKWTPLKRRGRPRTGADVDTILAFEAKLAKSPTRPVREIAAQILRERKQEPTEKRREALAKRYERERARLLKDFELGGMDGPAILKRWGVEAAAERDKKSKQ